MTGFYIIFDSYAFYEGMDEIDENSNIIMNISNCKLRIIDSVNILIYISFLILIHLVRIIEIILMKVFQC